MGIVLVLGATMTAAWPTIGTVQYALIQLANIDLRTTFQPDLGWARTAPIAIGNLTEVRFDMIMTGAELSNFMSWWEVDLDLGTEDFTGLEGVVGDNPSRYLFRRVPEWRVIRGGNAGNRLWRASFSLWRLGDG